MSAVRSRRAGVAIAVAIGATACRCVAVDGVRLECAADLDCGAGERCVGRLCEPVEKDGRGARVDPADASVAPDAGGTDAGPADAGASDGQVSAVCESCLFNGRTCCGDRCCP